MSPSMAGSCDSGVIERKESTSPTNQSLLQRLPENLLTRLFGGATRVRLNAGEVLFLVGDAGEGCYRVNDGLLKVTMLSRTGKERILAFLGRSAIVGEMSIIDRSPRSANVAAVRPAILSFVSSTDFRDFAKIHPEVYETLLALLAARLRETDMTVAAGTFLPVGGRIACTLLELAQEFGRDVGSGRILIHQKICQTDLAAMAGVSREHVNRILNDWKRHQLVSQLEGYYCIENKAQLQKEAELQYCVPIAFARTRSRWPRALLLAEHSFVEVWLNDAFVLRVTFWLTGWIYRL
jgi:CRP/FNR family transcriptional regulator, cyclic AMP receptor protein